MGRSPMVDCTPRLRRGTSDSRLPQRPLDQAGAALESRLAETEVAEHRWMEAEAAIGQVAAQGGEAALTSNLWWVSFANQEPWEVASWQVGPGLRQLPSC